MKKNRVVLAHDYRGRPIWADDYPYQRETYWTHWTSQIFMGQEGKVIYRATYPRTGNDIEELQFIFQEMDKYGTLEGIFLPNSFEFRRDGQPILYAPNLTGVEALAQGKGKITLTFDPVLQTTPATLLDFQITADPAYFQVIIICTDSVPKTPPGYGFPR